jgi:hypothetical protein
MTSIKQFLLATTAVLLLGGVSARAGLIPIPDGNPIGITEMTTVSGEPVYIDNVTVSIQIQGGNNGDLYGYLSYDGRIVTLLNRPGVSGSNPLGFTGSGFNITLSDGAFGNINTTPESPGGLVTGTFNAPGGSLAFESAFNGLNPNGTWTLFLADESAGGGQANLVSWSISVNAVPEPTNVALGIFGVCAVAGRLRAGWKRFRAGSNPMEAPK